MDIDLDFNYGFIKGFREKKETDIPHDDLIQLESSQRYHSLATDKISINCEKYSDEFMLVLSDYLQSLKNIPYVKESSRKYSISMIKTYLEIKAGNVESSPLNSLIMIPDAIKCFSLDVCYRHIFIVKNDTQWRLMYLTSASHVKKDRYNEAHAKFSFSYVLMGKVITRTFSIYKNQIQKNKTTIVDILNECQVYPCTKDVFVDYTERYARYLTVRVQLGHQFLAVGKGFMFSGKDNEDFYESQKMVLDKDNIPGKIVVDEKDNMILNHLVTLLHPNKFIEEVDESVDEEGKSMVTCLIEPVMRCFHLSIHEYMGIDVGCMTEYVYDESLIHKLILPESMGRLVNTLRTGVKRVYQDIVSGKVGGIFILSTGPAGTGKTLTAQVFSESTKTPLYTVQCSQLGISAVGIESKLVTILSRAQRWNATLLIDEADVYIRVRDNDLEHNAIVGVFLRILETYQGTIFMTSNQTDIDDAIVSRSLCHLTFPKPTVLELFQIWMVLGTNYGLHFSPAQCFILALAGHTYVGRDVKQLCRLMRFILDNDTSYNVTVNRLSDDSELLGNVFRDAVTFRGLNLETFDAKLFDTEYLIVKKVIDFDLENCLEEYSKFEIKE